MAITVSANGKSVVTKGSDGTAMATIPDVCQTPFPPPVGPLPIPYPNIAESKDLTAGSTMTKFDGNSVAILGSFISKSTGDEPGVLGGIISGTIQGKAFFLGFSPDVKVEMRPVCRKGDMMLMNNFNTLSLTGMMQDDVEDVESLEDLEIEKYTFEFTLINGEGNTIADEPYTAKHSNNVTVTGQSDSNGKIKIENVTSRIVKIKLDDQEEFELVNEKDNNRASKRTTNSKHMSLNR